MADYGFVARLLAVLHSLPLWLFVALAAAGYGPLFLPAFGGADIVELRQQWAPYFWLDATTFTVFALSCAADLIAKGLSTHVRTRNNHRRRLLRQRYFEVYTIRVANCRPRRFRGCAAGGHSGNIAIDGMRALQDRLAPGGGALVSVWDKFAVDSPLEESGFEPLVPLTPKRERCRFANK
jgi:hypothetical protein